MAKDKEIDPHPNPTQDLRAPGAGYTSAPIPPEDMLTEQEQDVLAGGTGVGPASASAQSVPVETMEAQGIGPRDPYPSADTPPPVAREKGKK
jgi:hypothetical protein